MAERRTQTAPTPMLATLHHGVVSGDQWLFERKLDGMRAVAVYDGTDARLWSRTAKPLDAGFPEVAEALVTAGDAPFVVDGELVAFDGAQTSFAKLQPRIHLTDARRVRESKVRVFYYLFDLLAYDGNDARDLPLRQRKQLLRDALDFDDPLRFTTHRNADGETYLREACRRGWEGLIAKRADSAYRGGRSGDWLKLKCGRGQEFVVGGFTDPQGSRTGFGALLLGYYDDGALRYAGKVGTGFDTAMLTELREVFDSIAQPERPFAEVVKESGAHWVRPEIVVQVEFSEWTSTGKLRHPRLAGVRTDKSPADVVRET